MGWEENDDNEVQICIDKLIKEETELLSKLRPIRNILGNIKQIQTTESSRMHDGIRETSKNKPRDKWGEEMTDEYRLETKNECITRTTGLLGD